ncbi:DUF5017 domain-containing protein [Flavobacterium agricola]|uniref:DUF5017 domain-containing protein n=1 Tax=Flavobacterium agricola TaxID=2870839 RepID=A0ABY6LYI6_9FLAO|nr:DUF5017 domain-containing protein [Flavobacterium agricola]UYW01052.1 DUF5017 domain-containing protein [Flavobacterium agricola]
MKKYIQYLFLLFSVSVITLSSCTNADDFEIPPFTHPFFNEDFTNQTAGSGSEDVPVAISGVINTNTTNLPVWGVRSFSNNKYMQFSSFYSEANTSDNVWFILPGAPVEANQNITLNFDLAQAFPVGTFPLNVYYSTDFDGDAANINQAVWSSISLNFPSATPNYEFVRIKNMNYLNESTNKQTVYIALVYKGAKTGGASTTVQVDNIKLIIN